MSDQQVTSTVVAADGRALKWLSATAAALILSAGLYSQLVPFSEWVVSLLPVDRHSHPGAAMAFFVHDTPKVLLLLTLVVFAMGVVRSFFSPEKTRALLAGRREIIGYPLATALGAVTPFCSCSSVPLGMKFVVRVLVILFACCASQAVALETVKVTDGIYAFVGEKQQRSPQNLANNATFGLIVTSDGAVLVDPGGSFKGAEMLHAAVRKVTDQPVRYVVNTGGQDHRWLGNGYWKAQGATIIASQAAVADHKDRGSMQLTMLTALIKDSVAGTDPVYADVTFEASHSLKLGGLEIEIHHKGQAHTPGDSFVWVPAKKTVFTGDIVYVERILGVGPQSNAKSWIGAFDAMAELKPDQIVPGHGAPTDLKRAYAETRAYLVNLREQIGAHIESGGDMIGAPKVDQSTFKHLEQFESLAGRNAQQVFSEMEFE